MADEYNSGQFGNQDENETQDLIGGEADAGSFGNGQGTDGSELTSDLGGDGRGQESGGFGGGQEFGGDQEPLQSEQLGGRPGSSEDEALGEFANDDR